MSKIISGTEIASQIKEDIRLTSASIKKDFGISPSIKTIIIGDNEASKIYVNNKHKAAIQVGIEAEIINLSSENDRFLFSAIDSFNKNKSVNAVLVQLPLPSSFDKNKIINSISPEKDVDGLTEYNSGKLFNGNLSWQNIIPCTPSGVVKMISIALDGLQNISGKDVLVVGKSNLVGKPLSLILSALGATVTMAGSTVKDLKSKTLNNEIIITATGHQNLIDGGMINGNAILIDVGISKNKNGAIVGDLDFDSCHNVCKKISPVPGGVGPMTIAYLLYNTIVCFAKQNGINKETSQLINKWGIFSSNPEHFVI